LSSSIKVKAFDIQANILKSHGRDFSKFLFIEFNESQAEAIGKCLYEIYFATEDQASLRLTNSNQKQIIESKNYKNDVEVVEAGASVVITIHFSSTGLSRIGKREWCDAGQHFLFEKGMRSNEINLKDPAAADWPDPNYKEDIHVLIVTASDSKASLMAMDKRIRSKLHSDGIAKRIFVEEGKKLPGGKEPFGYKDNISNPWFYSKMENKRGTKYYRRIGSKFKIVLDNRGGSFLVFRKLQQHKSAFDQIVRKLAKELHISRQEVEAQVMGRFKEGTPLAVSSKPNIPGNQNAQRAFDRDFSKGYQSDPDGLKCPLHAHIRKVNPRFFREKLWEEADRYRRIDKDIFGIIVRRGIPYKTEKEEGLLFMCYQANIDHQFQIVQQNWSNNFYFPEFETQEKRIVGYDPIAGQYNANLADEEGNTWNLRWGGKQKTIAADFRATVTFKGGEFFYAPSVDDLRSLNPDKSTTV
jgi:Dyp-type peroxidase family